MKHEKIEHMMKMPKKGMMKVAKKKAKKKRK